jgi:hypothetical protein
VVDDAHVATHEEPLLDGAQSGVASEHTASQPPQ